MSDSIPPMTVAEAMAEIEAFWRDPYAYHAQCLTNIVIKRLEANHRGSRGEERAHYKRLLAELRC